MSHGGVPPRTIAAGAEALDGGSVSGGILAAHIDWVRSVAGEAEARAIRNALEDSSALDVPGIFMPMQRYPFRLLVELDRLILARFHEQRPDVLHELGRHSVAVNHARNVSRLDRMPIHEYFERLAGNFGRFHEMATRASYARVHDTLGRLTIHAPVCYSPIYCASSAGYYQQLALRHGARSVQVREVQCRCTGDADCAFEIVWAI